MENEPCVNSSVNAMDLGFNRGLSDLAKEQLSDDDLDRLCAMRPLRRGERTIFDGEAGEEEDEMDEFEVIRRRQNNVAIYAARAARRLPLTTGPAYAPQKFFAGNAPHEQQL
jgi:hypothetical protein